MRVAVVDLGIGGASTVMNSVRGGTHPGEVANLRARMNAVWSRKSGEHLKR